MYKLLLVTDQEEIRKAFDALNDWESMGFRVPRFARNADEALETMKKHHVDAFALALPEAEIQKLRPVMLGTHAQKPIMYAPDRVELVRRNVEELRHLLNRTHADYSNDEYDDAEMMQLCRHDYFRTLISGSEKNVDAMLRRLTLLRSRMDPDRPCVMIELAHPDNDGYLTLHWRYGADRLEVAMRNFFGAELNGMRILVSVLPDERLFLLACPMKYEESVADEAQMVAQVRSLVEKNINDVQEYLNIDLRIATVTVLPGLRALVTGEA